MGLFSFIGKAAKGIGKAVLKVGGGLAKATASKLTGGLSDTVLKAVKGTGLSKSQSQADAMLAKIGPPSLRISRTERPSTVEGWGFGKRQPAKTARTPKRKPAQSRPARPRKAKAAPKPRKVAGPRKARPQAFKAGNPQAQRVKRLAAEWRAGGGTAQLGPFFSWMQGRA